MNNIPKNKKGFTLVEILAVIVLISLIIIIAVPSVKSISYKSKKKLFNTKVELTKEAVNLWGTNNKTCFTETGYCGVFTVCEGEGAITCTTTFGKLAENGIINYDEEDNGEEFVVNPVNSESLNNKELTVTLENDVVNTECDIAEEDGEHINREEDEDATGEANLPNITVPSDNQSNEAVLIVDANGGNYSGNEITETTKDTTIELSTPEKKGYEFTGWNIVYGDGSINGNNITIKSLVLKVRAQFKANLKVPVSFEEDDWETIAKYVRANKEATASVYKVGDTKKVPIGGTNYTVRIANNSHYDSDCKDDQGNTLDSQTACGFVVEFAEIIEKKQMNSNSHNYGGWPATPMYQYLNGIKYADHTWDRSNTLFIKLPDDLIKVIADTKVISGHGSHDSSNFTSTNDKLYLLSTKEVYGDCTESKCDDTATGVTRQLDYYGGKGVTANDYGEAKKYYNSTPAWWWLRSAKSWDSNYFKAVYSSGSHSGYDATSTGPGIAPAFRIG